MRRIITHKSLRGHCIICFLPTDVQTLIHHHHCCNTERHCEKKCLRMIAWETRNFGVSLLEQIIQELIATY